MRNYLAGQADLIAAYKLPSGVFSDSGTQVAIDMDIPKAEKGETALTDKDGEAVAAIENPEVYRKLIEKLKEKGILEKDIAFIQNYNTKPKRDDVFQRVDKGEVRILIGSTKTMGAGINCQKHLVALHDLDAPWRPRDLEQRHGRILRQGNENEEVEIFNYVVKDSFDANMWEKLKNKAAIIQQAMSGDMNMRTVEDADLVTLSYAEVEGAATGNPLIKEQLQVQNDLTKYQHAQTAFRKKVRDAENTLDGADERVEKKKREIAKVEKDIAQRKDTKGDKFSMLIGKTGYKERGKADEALTTLLENLSKRNPVEIGQIGGFRLMGYYDGVEPKLFLANNLSYNVNKNSVQGIEYVLQHAPETDLANLNAGLERMEKDIAQAEEIVKQENPYAEKVKALSDRLNQLNREIAETLVEDGKQAQEVAQKEVEPEFQNFAIEKTASGAYRVTIKDVQSVSNVERLTQSARLEDGYTGTDGSSFTFPKRINASNFARNNDGRVERLEKPSSNRKYSVDNSDNLGYNESRKYSLGEHIRSGHSRVNNKIVLNDTGTAIKSIELGLSVGKNETHDERVTRRLREIEGIDYTLVNKGGNSAFVNLVPDIQKAEIDERIRNGADPAELIQHYKVKFNTMIARYADGLSEEKRIGYALLLKGVAYYVAEKTGTSYNRERGGGIFDERPEGVGQGARAEEAGNHQNRIRPTSRSDESGFSNARSMDELKAEITEAFPGTKVEEQGNTLRLTMPNGQKVTATLHDSLTATDEELSKAKREHGIDQSVTVTVEGYAETVGADGFIALSQGSRKGTGFHEAYHIAEAMAFRKKELADAKRLISANEEERADAYAKWKLERKKGNNFAKLWQKIADVAAKLAGILGYETKRNIFRKVESGEIYRRDNTARDLSRKYSIDSADNGQESYLHRVKNFFSKSRAADTPEYRRMLKGMMEEIAGIKIRYGKIDPKMAAVYDSFKKVIRAKSANDWERVLPLFAGATLEKLGVKPNEKLNAYISDWIQTGAPNNNSKEAVIFQKAMKDNPEVADQLIDLQEAFQRWDKMNAMERGQNIISWQNQEYRKHCHGCNGYTLIGQGFGGCRGLAKNI